MTELVFILDRSGSMSGLEQDTIGGFNSMIEQQKKVIEELRQAAPQPSDSADPAPTEPVVLRSAA